MIHRWRIWWILFIISLPLSGQAQVEISGGIVVLNIVGEINYIREGWAMEQTLLPGAVVNTTDLIHSTDASMVVMCPDGRVRSFLPSELFSNDVIRCEVDPGEYIVGNAGMQLLRIQRSGRQDPGIPYLLSPRATALRQTQTTIQWKSVLDVQHYTIFVRAGSKIVWESGQLTPESVMISEAVAQTELPVWLEENVAYTVEICVLFANLRSGCTTDPGLNASVNLAFRYIPNMVIDEGLVGLVNDLGGKSPQALYAQAMLLSQPIAAFSSEDDPIAYYQEAITLLEELQAKYPGSDLANSPEFFNQLGELYRHINLPRTANDSFGRALDIADPTTVAAAVAALGYARTTVAGDEVEFYNQALNNYAAFLTESAFFDQFRVVCGGIGDICLHLDHCETPIADCST